MIDSVIIEIGIGMAAVFFVVASLVAAVNEWATRVLDIRAKVLWKALANLLDADGGEAFTIRTRDAYRAFIKADERPAVAEGTGAQAGLPSASERVANASVVKALGGSRSWFQSNRTRVDRIESATFVAALLELARTPVEDDITSHLREARAAVDRAKRDRPPHSKEMAARWSLVGDPNALGGLLQETDRQPELAEPLARAANAWNQAEQHRDSANDEHAEKVRDAVDLTIELDRHIERLEAELGHEADAIERLRNLVRGSPLESVLAGAVARHGRDLDRVMDDVGTWFDESMARLSDLYRNMSRQILFGVGLAIAIVGNVGAIDLIGDLRTSSELRDSLVAATETSCSEQTNCFDEVSEVVTLPGIGGYQPPWEALGLGGDTGGTEVPGAPVWQVLVGWLLTGVAVSFGAPFWFDTARRLASVRQVGGG